MILEKIDKEINSLESELIELRTQMSAPKRDIEDMEAQIYSKQLEVIKLDDRIREVSDRVNKLRETRRIIENSGWLNE